ncbi:MAG TPA: KpsF/GutQ family sugar-phosphate isomerase [Burkholderiales bacterium]|jgi:arabinose-5-phosphate isomerase|nr:KpsF/GutQ family sugar-phosphate isomerase [Burkholderiales bacterium]
METAPARSGVAAGQHPVLDTARAVLEIEAQAISGLIRRLDEHFVRAVDLIMSRRGRVIVSGIGKSGHIARKIASTFASTGTPAYFVHPAEASHGDLGMVARDDVFIALSNSGESAELLAIVPLLKRQGAKLIAMTGNPASTLAQEADAHLYSGAEKEACPLNLAPTASTTAALALGDALAIALMSAKGFTQDDFAAAHPGGALGRKLLTHVRDVMRTGANAPRIGHEATLMDGMLEMSRGRMGMTAVVDGAGRVVGVFTDGDLRRSIERETEMRSTRMGDVMTRNPRTIGPERLAAEAVEIMERNKVNQLLVVDDHQQLVGALNMHDLFRGKVI